MGKVFITDEVNDMYTADVTNASKIKVEDGASTYHVCTSAQADVTAEPVYDGACYLKQVSFGQYPVTAASFTVYDTYDCASSVSSFGASGANIVGTVAWDVGAASGTTAGKGPFVIPFNVYLASGLSVAGSLTAANPGGAYIGAVKNVSVVYQS